MKIEGEEIHDFHNKCLLLLINRTLRIQGENVETIARYCSCITNHAYMLNKALQEIPAPCLRIEENNQKVMS